MLIGTENAYQSARFLLQERYGNCNVVGTAFMNKLENFAIRGAEDLRDLSDFLQKIIAARETTPTLAVLDFAKENVKALNKLPLEIQNKCRGTFQRRRVSKGDGAYPTFSEFALFVKECAEKANIPELEELSKTKEMVRPRGPFRRSPRGKEAVSFGCASSSQHQVASCKNRLICRTCSGNQPNCLHNQKTPAESITNCTNVCTTPEQEGSSDQAMIVPV